MLRSYFFFADKPGDGVEKEGGTNIFYELGLYPDHRRCA